jgi:DNA-binding response OmpR family regulator
MVQNNADFEYGGLGAARRAVRTEDRPRVLIAEDDDEMRRLLTKVLYADGYATVECRDGVDLFKRLEPFVLRRAALDFDAIVSDVRMPGLTGLEILEDLHDCRGFPPVILVTAFGDAGIHIRARKAGAAAVLDKPFGTEELLNKLHEIAPREHQRMDERQAAVPPQ